MVSAGVETLTRKPSTINPTPWSPTPKPPTRNPKHQTLNPHASKQVMRVQAASEAGDIDAALDLDDELLGKSTDKKGRVLGDSKLTPQPSTLALPMGAPVC